MQGLHPSFEDQLFQIPQFKNVSMLIKSPVVISLALQLFLDRKMEGLSRVAPLAVNCSHDL